MCVRADSQQRITNKAQSAKFIDVDILAQNSESHVLAQIIGSNVHVQLDWPVGIWN